MSSARAVATEVEAANVALAHIGEPGIARLDEPRAVARLCRQHLAQVRDEVLRRHPWNFATAWTRPARSGDAPGVLSKRFPLPGDCLAVRGVEGLLEDQWAVEGDAADALILVTSVDAPHVRYTRRVIEPARWDPLFVLAFSYALAARVAPVLARDAGLVDNLEEKAEKAILRASRADGREAARAAISRDVPWIRVRR